MNSCPKIPIEILFCWSCNGHPRKKFPCGAAPPGGTPPIGGGAPAKASRAPKLPRRGSLGGYTVLQRPADHCNTMIYSEVI